MAKETLGLKNINLLTKAQYKNITNPAKDELYAVETTDNSIVEAYNGTSSWYRLYSDGFIIQGGYTTTASAGMTITLPHIMKDGNYSCVATKMAATSEHSVAVTERTNKTFTFAIRGFNGASNQPSLISWQLEGYIK